MEHRICKTCDKLKSIDFFRGNRTQCRECGNYVKSNNLWVKRYGDKGNPAHVDLEEEIWKPIETWDEYYLISNKSRVKSILKGIRWAKIKSQIIGTTGYWCVHLSVNGHHEFRRVHRLLAKSFIPNPENKPCINHKDGNRLNNDLPNLEWATYSENLQHAYDMGLAIPQYGETSKRSKLTSDEVLEIYNCDLPSKDMSFLYNVSSNTINGIKTGRVWGHLTGKFHPSLKHREKIWKEIIIPM